MAKAVGRRKTKRSLHTLSQGSLEQKALAGDLHAWNVLVERQIVRRMVIEPEPLVRDHYVLLESGLWLRFLKEDERVTFLIEIRGDTSFEMERQSWQAIDTWRRLLGEWQGSTWRDMADGWLCAYLAQEHRGRKSYATLAQELNDLIARMLSWIVNDEKAMQAATEAGQLRSDIDRLAWRNEHKSWSFGTDYAQQLLRAMGLSDADIERYIQDGLQRLKNGQHAFLVGDAPIERDHVISRVRAWRSRQGGIEAM